jgi:hypothetical protein
VCKVRHSHQFKPAVEDAKQFIALKIKNIDILGNLPIRRRKTEAKVAITCVQRDEMLAKFFSMPWSQRTNWDPDPLPGAFLRQGRLVLSELGRATWLTDLLCSWRDWFAQFVHHPLLRPLG